MRITRFAVVLSLVCSFVALAMPAQCKVVYVNCLRADDSGDGLTWNTAKKTVTAGIAASVSGDEVWVSCGTYIGSVTLAAGVGLYGGFAGSESARGARDWKSNVTILDGGSSGGVSASNFLSGPATIDGFTIRNGDWGIYCGNASLVISNNTITENACSGIDCSSSSATTITNNTITSNGGGILCYSSPALICNNIITSNVMMGISDYGGGICCINSACVIADNIIAGNSAAHGGGIDCDSSSPTITNNTVACNSATDCGGISCHNGSSPSIFNNIVAYNSSGIYSSGAGSPTLRNNDIYNPDGFNYSGLAAGTADLSADPSFASSEHGNYHIQPGSPCSDAGWNGAPGTGTTDIDGQSRIFPASGTVDIGADESDGTQWKVLPLIVRVDGTNGSDLNDGSSWALAKRTIQAGIAAAGLSGGEIWVKAGTYGGPITLNAFSYVYGGFTGTESTRDARNWTINVTVLDGSGSSATSVVAAISVGFRLAAIDGFTIRNAKYNGVYCGFCSPIISHNTITGNPDDGIYCSYSNCLISNNMIVGNARIGIDCRYSSCYITNNTMVGNGVGVGSNNCSPVLSNNIIACGSEGVACSFGSAVLRNNDVFCPNGPNYTGVSAGTGDMSADPKFASYLCGNYHIQPDSPCLNAGWNGADGIAATDIDDQPRTAPTGGNVDIGADESDGTSWCVALPLTVRVDGVNGSDANDGSSWQLAKKTVQAAINTVSTSVGEVWVKAGIYNERLTLKANAFVYGGFSGTESTRVARNAAANTTILDGGGLGSVVSASGISWGRSGIDGFTIRNGNSGNGGGVYCYNASPFVSHNVITGNTASSQGGGVYSGGTSRYLSATVSDNVITGNTSDIGGGLWGTAVTGTFIVSNNTFNGNTATSNGGGVYLANAATQNTTILTVSNNTISNNRGAYGGGVYLNLGTLASATFSGNMVTGNSATNGGGLYGINSPTISNNTFAGNTASIVSAGGIQMTSSVGASPAKTSNNIIAYNSSGIVPVGDFTLSNNDVYNPGGSNYQGVSTVAGNVSVDPLFVNRKSGNYHLSATSPCINAGWNASPGLPALDIDGQKRVQGGTVDIGADEWWPGVGNAKQAADNSQIQMSGMIVSGAFPGFFYIESGDRGCGIRVEIPDHGLSTGMMAEVAGALTTNSDGERCIAATSVYPSGGTGFVTPLAVNNRSVGGGTCGYQLGVWDCAPVKDTSGNIGRTWAQTVGTSNIGLLITTWGKVTYADQSCFYVDDGSKCDDNSGYVGMKVYGSVPVNPGVDPVGAMVAVTGISSCERSGSNPVRVIRTRGVGDVRIISY